MGISPVEICVGEFLGLKREICEIFIPERIAHILLTIDETVVQSQPIIWRLEMIVISQKFNHSTVNKHHCVFTLGNVFLLGASHSIFFGQILYISVISVLARI